MPIYPDRERFTAWVVFQGAEHRRFWRIFTVRGWRHVFVILPAYYPEPSLDADVYSIVFNPRTNYLSNQVLFKSPRELAKIAHDAGATAVIKYPFDTIGFRDYAPRGFITCVSLVKMLLGIRSYFVLTPKHLARWLLRNGGELVKKDFG